MDDKSRLADFLGRICEKIQIAEFQTALDQLFEGKRTKEDVKNARLSRGPWKKVIDEVVPVSRYLKVSKIKSGQMQFALNDQVPDCLLWKGNSRNSIGVEITICMGKARHYLSRELVQKGLGRGFIGLQDSASKKSFEARMAKPRIMYSTDQALSAMARGIGMCLKNKNRQIYAGMILLIQARLRSLPDERWAIIKDQLVAAAATSPFQEVHIIGDTDCNLLSLKIKP